MKVGWSKRIRRRGNELAIGAAALFLAPLFSDATATAHPHEWPLVKVTVLFDDAGRFAGARENWSFDPDASGVAIYQADLDKNGYFDDAELAAYIDVYLAWVARSDYMTRLTVGGMPVNHKGVEDYTVKFLAGKLTLEFTLPLETPVAVKTAGIDVFDATFYYDFEFDVPDFAAVKAPASCVVGRRASVGLDPVAAMLIKKLSLPSDHASLMDDPATGFNVRVVITC